MIKRILRQLFSLIQWLLTSEICNFINIICKFIRNVWYCNYFHSCGEKVRFKKVCTIHGADYIDIGDGTSFGDGLCLTAWPELANTTLKPSIKIGKNCQFGAYNHITALNSITIGDNLLTGKWVTISDNSHGEINYNTLNSPPLKRQMYSKGSIVIGKNVWIGDKATILPNVEVGDCSVIAANAVVTSNVPAYSVVAGVPARVMKQLVK